MIESEIFEVVAYWEATHGQALAQSTKALYLLHLANVERRDALAAIDDCARRAEFPPSPQRIAEVSVECRYERLEIEAGAKPFELGQGNGPGFAEWLEANPDQHALLEKIREVTPRAGPPMTRAEREELGQEDPPRTPGLYPGDICAGIGKPSVLIDGISCCSVCESPVERYRKVWVRDESKRGGHWEMWQEGGCYPSKAIEG